MPAGKLSADAVPMLSAADSPMLILEARPQQLAPRVGPTLPLRRKSSLPANAAALGGNAPRRRGSSVPPCPSSSSPPAAPPPAAASGPANLGPPPGAATSRRRGLTLSRKFMSARREEEAAADGSRRRVRFKTVLPSDAAPCPAVLSYDELLFNVAGLYQTTDFLHEPEDFGEARARDEEGERSHSSSRNRQGDPSAGGGGGEGDVGDGVPPLERSMPLMIAEFLYRSAVYLGYPSGDKPWLPGFRESKRFSTNDVRRWRRLAHFDWAREDRELERRRRQLHDGSDRGRGLLRKDSSSSVEDGEDYRVDGPALPSTAVALPSHARERPRSRGLLRAAVSKMSLASHRRRRHKHQPSGAEASSEDDGGAADDHGRPKVDMEHPPPVDPRLATSGELSALVAVVNACVYCGPFRFRARDVVTLCNVDIDRVGA